MKKILSLLSLAALTVGLLGSCAKIDERISNLEKRIDGIESNQIASIKSQVDAINTSIADLGTIRQNVQTLMNTTPSKEDIEELRKADEVLGRRIDELKSYTDGELTKYATTEWVKATFATLEQHQWTCDTIAKIDARIGALDAKLSQSISGLESSLKQWVNEQLDAYYTAAQMDAKLDVMRNDINNAKVQGKTATDKADSLATELTTLKTAVDTAKANIRNEYKAAIQSAIETSEGKLSQALKDSIAEVNNKISALDTKVKTLEGKVLALEGKVDKLLAMIQSVSITPAYSDGSVEAVDGILTLKCIVSPAEALTGMESLKDSLLLYADSVKVKTKATTPAYMTIEVSEASVLDADQGAITLTADISEYLPKGEGKALTVAVNIKNGISDFTTEFVPVTATKIPTFKAVYNTNDGANTLTFYYDNSLHVGEGVLYDNLPSAATGNTSWGYDVVRKEIKKVVITESVKNYSCLTSTACMFNNMTAASYISGAEYLDVSKVTNMMAMFWNFGSKSGTLSSVPDVKDWNTGSVTNMQNMFTSYGAGSKDFNAVPDVGKWNTASVTNMTNMFWSFGSYSSTLSSVPDVKEWNTASVTNMNSMFESYGEISINLNKVPDVSKWNTDRVTDMGDMFLNYGYNSTALNTVPDVSGWNTINVTTMTNMFKNYGYSSTALSTVPNVSNWNTGNVTSLANMFNGYGYKSTNISCVLDLSGWDLSKITSGDDVFKFNPKTFDVTIPAKTGEKSNEGGKWYYGNGTNNITPPTDKTFTLEYVEIGGVKWATKNLGATTVAGSGETCYGDYYAWGETAPYYEGTGGWPATPTWKSGKASGYAWQSYCGSSSFSEWSTPPYDATTKILKPEFDAAAQILGNGWRMPTSAEFEALFDACGGTETPKTGGSTSTTEKGVYWCDNYDGVAGCLFCDGTNRLFFPAAGDGEGTSLVFAGDPGIYWSSSLFTGPKDYANGLIFGSYGVNPQGAHSRYLGFPVRPVTIGSSDSKPVVPVTGVTLDKTELSLKVGKSETLKATVQPADATNKNVIWSSDNTSVATVGSTDGKVTALAAGTATITATTVDGSKTAPCEVTVIAPNSLEKYNTEEW